MNNDFKVIDDTLYSGIAAEDIIQRRKSPVPQKLLLYG